MGRFVMLVALGVLVLGCANVGMPTPAGTECCRAKPVELATGEAVATGEATAGATVSSATAVGGGGGVRSALALRDGDLFLPSGWLRDPMVRVAVRAVPGLEAVALSGDGEVWGEWVPATGGMTVTVPWDFGEDGRGIRVFARGRDAAGGVTNVISGTVNLDTVPPVSFMTELPPHSSRTFGIEWGGEDGLSGVESFDVQLKVEAITDWSDWLKRTTLTRGTLDGEPNERYFFRVRARDAAGNVEEWREFDVTTYIPQTD